MISCVNTLIEIHELVRVTKKELNLFLMIIYSPGYKVDKS